MYDDANFKMFNAKQNFINKINENKISSDKIWWELRKPLGLDENFVLSELLIGLDLIYLAEGHKPTWQVIDNHSESEILFVIKKYNFNKRL
jgi:hypothetical protein